MKNRLNEFFTNSNILKNDFINKINVSESFWLEENEINTYILVKITESYPSLNIRWLLIGEGNMLEVSQENMLKVSCDEENCLKNYVIKLQKEKINRLEKVDVNDSTYTNSYSLN